MKQCRRCLQSRPLTSFIERKIGGGKRIGVCHDCRYKNAKSLDFLWETASDKEKLRRVEKNFNKMVIKQDGCWGWKGFIRPDGYTRIKFGSRITSVGAHVVSWMIKHKKIIKKGECILHKCDNRHCTNPKHLYLGTHSDNMIDMVNRRRHPLIKLSVDKVKSIKRYLRRDAPISLIAERYGVHWATINDIKHNKTWKHVK